MTLWLVASGSYRGRDHALRGVNRQDEAICGTVGDSAFGFVADGCGEGRHSELAARISVEVAARAVAKARDLTLEEASESILREVVAALRGTLATVGPVEPRPFILDHLCSTLLGFVVRGQSAVLFTAGDGSARVDDGVTKLGDGGPPSYLAYALLGGTPRVVTKLVHVEATIAVATDGVTLENLRGLAPRASSLTRHLVLMERRGELLDDGGVAMAMRTSSEVAL